MTPMLLAHNGADASHAGTGSSWTALSMIAFSLFLLVFAWSLLRPSKRSTPTAAELATERSALGRIGDDGRLRVPSDLDTDTDRR